jgi:BTB/POZ domain-containing protein 13
MHTEFSIYVLLRFWVFLQLHPEWDSSSSESVLAAKDYFQNRKDEEPFLLTREGKRFAGPFQALRLQHLMNYHLDIDKLKCDRIVPQDWLAPFVSQQWDHMYRLNLGLDTRLKSMENDEFCRDCVRCGRTLVNAGIHIWSWILFNMRPDLIWSCDTHTLRVKRNPQKQNEAMLSMQTERHVLCRVTLMSLNEQRQVKHKQSTGLKSLSLLENEEVTLLLLDKDLTYPLLLSVSLMFNYPVTLSQ